MKTLSLQELKSCDALGALGADFVFIVDADGTKWLLAKQIANDEYALPMTEREKALIKRIALYAIQEQTISASAIQREFKMGYARACHILDYMENAGYISSANGIEPRKVFATQEQIEKDFL